MLIDADQQSSSFREDNESTSGSDKSHPRSVTPSSPTIPHTDKNFVIQPKNIKLNEMFILQSLKNQMKRKTILGLLGKSKSGHLKIKRATEDEKKWSLRQSLMAAINTPLDLMCKATIPCCDEKRWSRKRATVNPFFGLLVFLIAT